VLVVVLPTTLFALLCQCKHNRRFVVGSWLSLPSLDTITFYPDFSYKSSHVHLIGVPLVYSHDPEDTSIVCIRCEDERVRFLPDCYRIKWARNDTIVWHLSPTAKSTSPEDTLIRLE
jgi:hypothetical protein